MEARRILTIIKYNNKDISADISKYLKSISYTDNLSGEADDLQITLEDRGVCGNQHGCRKKVRCWMQSCN